MQIIWPSITSIYIVFLTYMSLRPYLAVQGTDPVREFLNNLAHVPAYSILTYLLIRCVAHLSLRAVIRAFIFSIGYGALMEICQMAVPSRTASWNDLGLNVIGSLTVVIFFYIKMSSRQVI